MCKFGNFVFATDASCFSSAAAASPARLPVLNFPRTGTAFATGSPLGKHLILLAFMSSAN